MSEVERTDSTTLRRTPLTTPLELAQRVVRGFMPPPERRLDRGVRPIGEQMESEPDLVRFVIAVIPAHDEAHRLERTLASLANQTRPVDAVIVVADNCTDDTVAVALACGASVVETVGNSARKAGALNFALAEILPVLDASDAVLLMDADTELSVEFVAATTTRLWRQQRGRVVGGVGGIFVADDDEWSLVRQLQTNEYVRYARHLGRRRGRALVMTGTGSVFSVGALREVVAARATGVLPDLGHTGGVYDTSALTEDNELTVCLKALGYRTISPQECLVFTSMMPTWNDLFHQRRRWQRGALENIAAHSPGRHILPYAGRQVLSHLGVLFPPFYLLTVFAALHSGAEIDVFVPLWVLVGMVYVIEQSWSVRRGGRRAVVASLAVLPELALNMFLNMVYVSALVGAILGSAERWGDPASEMVSEMARETALEIADPNSSTMGSVPVLPASSGEHLHRASWQARMIEVPVLMVMIAMVAALLTVPFVALPAAWMVLSVYVLCGFALTLFRLIPLPMS